MAFVIAGDKPQESKGTLLRINIGEKLEHDKWTAMQEVDSDGTRLTFFIQPAAGKMNIEGTHQPLTLCIFYRCHRRGVFHVH